MEHKPVYSLRQLVLYFLQLGSTGFGGPVALVGYMRKDLVENRQWISDEEYKQGLALAQLAPGPLAAQLGIYIGFVHYRILGATLAGIAFVMPSFIMVVLLGMAYKLYGGLPWMQAVFYGVGAAVIGIIANSSYKLTIKSIGQFNLSSFKQNWLLRLFFVAAAAITFFTQQEQVLLFVGAGLIYMLVKAPPKWINQSTTNGFVLLQTGFWNYEGATLTKIAIFFAQWAGNCSVFTCRRCYRKSLANRATVCRCRCSGYDYAWARCYHGGFYRLFGGRFSGGMRCSTGYLFTLLFIYRYSGTLF